MSGFIGTILGICLLVMLTKALISLFKYLFCKKDSIVDSSVSNAVADQDNSSGMLYYVNISKDHSYTNEFGEIIRGTTDNICGPFTLSELKNEYHLIMEENTLITTSTLNGEWYEAKCFECFDDLFGVQQGFRINEFGEIVRS